MAAASSLVGWSTIVTVVPLAARVARYVSGPLVCWRTPNPIRLPLAASAVDAASCSAAASSSRLLGACAYASALDSSGYSAKSRPR